QIPQLVRWQIRGDDHWTLVFPSAVHQPVQVYLSRVVRLAAGQFIEQQKINLPEVVQHPLRLSMVGVVLGHIQPGVEIRVVDGGEGDPLSSLRELKQHMPERTVRFSGFTWPGWA